VIECPFKEVVGSQIELTIVGELGHLLAPARLDPVQEVRRWPGAFMFHLVGDSLIGCKAVLVFLDQSRKRSGGITDILFLLKGSEDIVIKRGYQRAHHGAPRIALSVRLRS
jgi:hypothetical protein